MENEEILKLLKRIDRRSKSTNGWVLFLGVLTILGILLSLLVAAAGLVNL